MIGPIATDGRERVQERRAGAENGHSGRMDSTRKPLIPTPSWRHHPGVRSGTDLTTGERAADAIRNKMGSWGFIFAALVFLVGWMLGNRNVGFDKYPFILLNLILSCVAALQGAILLIAAKREDQISSELARHDYETNLEADAIVKEIRALTMEIHSSTVAKDPAPAPAGSQPQ